MRVRLKLLMMSQKEQPNEEARQLDSLSETEHGNTFSHILGPGTIIEIVGRQEDSWTLSLHK